jgi:hypothetical protein
MSVEFRQTSRDGGPSFIRPIDRHPAGPRDGSPDPYAHLNRRRNSTWVTTNQRTVPPPPEPIPIPSPVANARGYSESVEEHMSVEIDPLRDGEAGRGSPVGTNRRRGFMGGFVSGLKKLPKVMMKRYTSERSPVRSGTGMIPHYDDQPPIPIPVGRPSDVQFAEETMEIPARQDDIVHEQVASDSTGIDHDGATTLVHDGTWAPPPPPIVPIIGSPVSLTSDYESNMPFRSDIRSDASLGTHVSRLIEVLSNLKHMPWIAQSRVTFDYIPGETNRKRFSQGRRQTTWYPSLGPRSSLDLLEGASPLQPPLSSIPPHKPDRSSIPESPSESHSGHGHRHQPSYPTEIGHGQVRYPRGYVAYESYQVQPSYGPPISAPTGWGQPVGFGGQSPPQVTPGFVVPEIHEPIMRPPPALSA